MYNLAEIIITGILVCIIAICIGVYFFIKRFKKPKKLLPFVRYFDNKIHRQFVAMNKEVWSYVSFNRVSRNHKLAFTLFWCLGFISEVVFRIVTWCLGAYISPLALFLGIIILYLYILMVVHNKYFITKVYKVEIISVTLISILFLQALIGFIQSMIFGLYGYIDIVTFIAGIGNMIFYGTLLYTGYNETKTKVENILVYSGAGLAILLQLLGLFGCFNVPFGYAKILYFIYSICASFYLLYFYDGLEVLMRIYNKKILRFYDNVIVKKILKKEPKIREGSKLKEYDVEIEVKDNY